MGSPLVSGTQIRTKNNATTPKTPNIRKVKQVPIASVNDRNDCDTIRFEIQFAVAAIPPHIPLNLKGYISELTIQGIEPMPGEKNIMYRARPMRANHPNLLGHPLVYHKLFSSPWQTCSTLLFAIKQAPGSSWKSVI